MKHKIPALIFILCLAVSPVFGDTCPDDYPYLCSDGYCYDVPCSQVQTCPDDYPYLCSDGYCYDVPCNEVQTCPDDHPYLCSDGYCYDVPCSEVNNGGSSSNNDITNTGSVDTSCLVGCWTTSSGATTVCYYSDKTGTVDGIGYAYRFTWKIENGNRIYFDYGDGWLSDYSLINQLDAYTLTVSTNNDMVSGSSSTQTYNRISGSCGSSGASDSESGSNTNSSGTSSSSGGSSGCFIHTVEN